MTNNNYCESLQNFLTQQNWELYAYQQSFLNNLNNKKFNQFLICSETGTGKTFTTFLPIILDKFNNNDTKLIYVAPIKALINDLLNNLRELSSKLKINLDVQKRTGDESSQFKKKQLISQPDILLTTPESLAILMTKDEAKKIFQNTDYLIVDELSEIINTKRGDQTALIISRIVSINKNLKIISSTTHVKNTEYLVKWLSINGKTKIINNNYKKKIEVKILFSKKIPDYGHSCEFLLEDIYKTLKDKQTIIFVNTRSQAEILFMNLFSKYKDLRIAIHHGSLSKKIRLDTERKMRNKLINTIISTSSLEMGIDWNVINQIINIGTPKSINRLIQRIGRSNHKYHSTPKAFIVPTNKLEYFESQACINLLKKKEYDIIEEKEGSKDVLCQHLLILACNFGFNKKKIYHEITKTYPFRNLKFEIFKEIVLFVYNGGYILDSYSNWSRLNKDKKEFYKINNQSNKTNILMNIGTIIDSANIRVMSGKKYIGEVDENFVNFVKVGDIFNFSGNSMECLSFSSQEIRVKKSAKKTTNVPIYWGGNLSFKKNLTKEILRIFSNKEYHRYPKNIIDFIEKQKKNSFLPAHKVIVVESFPFQSGSYLFMHTFQGRQTNHTLSNLLVNCLNENGYLPLDYSLNEYSLGIYIKSEKNDFTQIIKKFFSRDFQEIKYMDTHLAKKIFKEISFISCLIPRNSFKKEKNYINSDSIFDTLMKYQPSHILMKITKEEIQNFFSQKSQICSFFRSDYKYSALNNCSEFSLALLNEKPKHKIQSPI